MSQAHYVRCGHMTPAPTWMLREIGLVGDAQCDASAVVVMHMPYFLGMDKPPMCLRHMIEFFDRRDEEEQEGNPFRHAEPHRLEWVYDAGTRMCPLHHWPDVVCADWGREHAALLRAMWPGGVGRTLVEPLAPTRGA